MGEDPLQLAKVHENLYKATRLRPSSRHNPPKDEAVLVHGPWLQSQRKLRWREASVSKKG